MGRWEGLQGDRYRNDHLSIGVHKESFRTLPGSGIGSLASALMVSGRSLLVAYARRYILHLDHPQAIMGYVWTGEQNLFDLARPIFVDETSTER